MTDLDASAASDPLARQARALIESPAPPAEACLALARDLYQAHRFGEGERLTARAVAAHPGARDLWNIRGVFLRMLRRPREALAALDEAVRLDPGFTGGMVNRGNVLLDLADGQAALAQFTRLLDLDPHGPMPRTLVGRALLRLGRADEAVARFREAVSLKADYAEAWLDLIGALNHLKRFDEVESALNDALLANPGNGKLLEGKALMLRVSGQTKRAETFLRDMLAHLPAAAWVHFHLGNLLTEIATEEAIGHLRRADQLEPNRLDHMMVLLQALERSQGGDEGERLDEAHALALRVRAHSGLNAAQTALLRDVFVRVSAFADLESLGSFEALGRSWAEGGLHNALLRQMGQATTPARVRELVEQHRIWGHAAEALTARAPIRRPAPRAADGRVRLGIMSSDLRDHPVGYFALPLLEHIDRSRFEVFVYSYYRGPADAVQSRVQALADRFYLWPEIAARDAAQRIADDQLDLLIELGGSTYMNKLEVMAYRPAPLQASWLGYPHSSGLTTIDHYICDTHNAPTDPALLIEQPLVMSDSWIAMSPALVARAPQPSGEPPERRKGHLTYGTANNPHKFTADLLAAWARITAATPGAHFAFIRPEAGSRVFRRNVESAFAAQGVSADRIDWHVTRGGHMAAYEEIDISLDTFPLTGGTTTVESLLMGVPVVSLAGEAVFERLSRSILINAGLGDLCTTSIADYEACALRLAGDFQRRLSLRETLRATLEASPLGQTEAFARDFYDMIYRSVRPEAD
jgi:protein O-GlcNAc transferase